MERYEAKHGLKPGDAPYLWDSHLSEVVATFVTFDGAKSMAWIRNAIYSGRFAGVAK